MHAMFFGADGLTERMSQSRQEVKRLLGRVRREPRSDENVSRLLRVVYCLSFLQKACRIRLWHRLGRERFEPVEVAGWPAATWIAEVESWPETAEKHLQLYNLHLAEGDDAKAERALRRLEEHLPLSGSLDEQADLDKLWGPLRRLRYERLVETIRVVVEAMVPVGARVIVVSRGDDGLLELNGREAWHFPRDERGVYAGHYPANGKEAVAHLEELRKLGGEFLVFPSTAFWWFDHYPELRRHLRRRYRSVLEDASACAIYSLNEAPRRPAARGRSKRREAA
jgi:hypothetical protein